MVEKNKRSFAIILLLVLGVLLLFFVFYLLNKTDNKVDEKGNETDEIIKGNVWNGIYQKDENNHRVLLFTEDDKIASLKFAQEHTIADKKHVLYSLQYENGMVIEDGKMFKKDEEDILFIIERNKDKIIIKYVGKPEEKDGYIEFIGTYTKIKTVNSSDLKEFDK